MLLDTHGHCKISDLGLATRIPDGKGPRLGYAGTPGYTAPEVCLANPSYTVACEFFSYAVMIYRFLSGKKPYVMKRGFDRALPDLITFFCDGEQ